MARAFCPGCKKRWYYWQGGITVIESSVNTKGKTIRKERHYHKDCYGKS